MYKNLRSVIFIIGVFSLIFTLLMLIPMIVNYYTGHRWQSFFFSCFFTLFFSIICIFCGKLSRLKKTEVFIVTSSVWIVLSVMSAIPFMFVLKISFIDAFFEAVSGLTTTGATVLTNLQDKSPGILIWRSLLNAVGGLGIIVTGIFLLPCLKVMNLHELYHSESSEISKKFKYGLVKSSVYIFMIYCTLIALCFILYCVTGMSVFDAICHAMSTVSTGGFSNYDNSLQHFNNLYIEIIAIVFMLLSSCPFIVYLKIITKQRFYEEQVILFFAIICFFVCVSVISCCLHGEMAEHSLFDIFRYSIFSVISLSTSTGFVNYGYDSWYFFSVFGVFMMLIGGCSGSTNSGIKVYRIALLIKSLISYISEFVYPSNVRIVRYNRREVNSSSVCDVGMFFFLYIFVFFSGCIIVAISGIDFMSVLSAVSAILSNTGPGMGNVVGPNASYYSLLPSVKLFLSFLMLMGRLEIIPFFASIYLIIGNLSKSK